MNPEEKRFLDKVIELGAGEIIEDTPKKKIEKLSDELTYIKLVDNKTFRKNVVNKINEIIDKVNGEDNE